MNNILKNCMGTWVSIINESVDSIIDNNINVKNNQLDEGIKNKVLSWFGVKSNETLLEDIVDLIAAKKENTPEFKEKVKELAKEWRKSLGYRVGLDQAQKKREQYNQEIPVDDVLEKVKSIIHKRLKGRYKHGTMNKDQQKLNARYNWAIQIVVEYMCNLVGDDSGAKYARKQREEEHDRIKEIKAKKDKKAKEDAEFWRKEELKNATKGRNGSTYRDTGDPAYASDDEDRKSDSSYYGGGASFT